MHKVEPQGWLTFAHNTDEVDYLKLAYMLALSVKLKCSVNRFAIVVDEQTAKHITDQHRQVFDHIIKVDNSIPVFYRECMLWDLTPFKETIKVEADMLIPRNIDHWWYGLRQQDVVLTTNIRDYQGNVSTTRKYRKFFDSNNLPDVYNGFMYVRYSQESKNFFSLAKNIYKNFDIYKNNVLKYCNYETPDTDVVFGIAAASVETPCYSTLSYPTFTHMKPAVNNWKEQILWTDAVSHYFDNDMNLIVGGYVQQYPYHYHEKNFCTDELVEKYERAYRSI